ncbi:hypothetical protein [Hymenobacter sp. PAMC 26628]|uniref:hypothetical protein n=1 Tax=Hymenobacter sp. PAMC 26628 TaxID=1484118 RepID=UPI000770523F|nr:hypothetical protein [Hymenobacter sp. PAMC 26628]AMJ64489.1 hypothetical protein AXW84_02905 [Hymenobacter sp. PAMC 26628]
MNDKYSPAKCAQYGCRLAARLCDQHFGPQPAATLDGPALLRFTPVRQLNLLVLRQLLTQWQAEAARLRSPYFDFDAAPVQASLAQLMNTLSRHIRLNRTALESLLAQAIAGALSLATAPAAAAQHLLFSGPEPIAPASLRDNLRYIDLDKEFYQGFVDNLPATTEGFSAEFLSHRFELYQAANYRAHDAVQRFVETLSALLPLTTADLLEEGPVAAPQVPATQLAAVQPVISAPVALEPVTVPLVTQPLAESVALLPMTNVPLYEKLKASQGDAQPLAETLRAHAAHARPPEHAAPKVETLRAAISINQRFSFINELFNGENMEYHAAVQHLDALPTAEQARAYLTNELAQRYDWTRKEEHVGKLLKLIERKFA